MKNRTRNIILLCICLLVGFCIVDIFNLPSRVGIRIDNINWNAMNLICGNIVVVGLAVITYYLIDKRQQERQNNQRNLAVYLLQKTYENCKMNVDVYEYDVCEIKNTEKLNDEKRNKTIKIYQQQPFLLHADILEMAKQGVIKDKEYEMYLEVKASFEKYVVVLFGTVIDSFFSETCLNQREEEVLKKIEEAQKALEASA